MENVLKYINDFFAEIISELVSWQLTVLSWLTNNLFGAPLGAWLASQGFSIEFPDEVFNVLNEITYGVGYILPLYSLLPIVWIMLTFYVAKILLSVFGGVTKFLSFGLK